MKNKGYATVMVQLKIPIDMVHNLTKAGIRNKDVHIISANWGDAKLFPYMQDRCRQCGKGIDLDDATTFKTLMHQGRHFYVCSSSCMMAFYR